MNENSYTGQNLGMKWYVFFAQVRPWLSIISSITTLGSNGTNKASLIFPCITIILEFILFIKSFGKAPGLLNFIRFYLIFNFCTGAIAVLASDELSAGLGYAGLLLIIVIWFLAWYRPNINYFKRRLIPSEPQHIEYNNYYYNQAPAPEPQYTSAPAQSAPDTRADAQRFTYVCDTPEDTSAYSAGNRFKCSRCGAYYPTVFTTCDVCQTRNSVVALNPKKQRIIDGVSGTAPASESHFPNFCKECGAKLTEDSKFCQNCGTKVI